VPDTQSYIVDLRVQDQLTGSLAKAKDAVGSFGDSVSLQTAKAQNAFGNLGDSVRAKFAGIGGDIQKGIGLGLGIGTVQIVAGAIRGFTQGVGDAVDAARDLGETINKSAVVFGPAAVGVKAFGETAAGSLGLSEQAAIAAASQFGNLFVSLGLARDKVAPMSTQLVRLASDLASFNNIDVSEALEKLQSGIVGEARPLRELGVAINETAVKTEAARLGFKALSGEFTEAEKVQARYSLILKLTGTAQGDFERTSKDLANSQRILDARLQELSASAGKVLIPVITELTHFLTDTAIPAIESFGNAAGDIVDTFQKVQKGVGDARVRIPILADAVDLVTGAFHAGRDPADAWTHAAIAASQGAAVAEAKLHTLGRGFNEADNLAAAAANTLRNELAAAEAKVADQTDLVLGGIGLVPTRFQSASKAAQELAGKFKDVDDAAQALNFTLGTVRINGENLLPGGTSLGESFLSDLDQAQRNRDAAQARSDAAAADRLAKARAAAEQYASVIRERVAGSFDKAADRADILFDKLHQRHLQAIADAEKLADAQHTTALQAIADALRLRLEANAAPVTAAEEAQRRLELQRQRRDLGASLQAAQISGDPLAIRNAQEALQSFNAQQRIAGLREQQAKLDLAAQKEASAAQKEADDKLAAAKLAQAKSITEETERSAKQQADFDRALAALRVRDAKASPAKVAADIKALEERFGITTDVSGFHHITDVLERAIKTIKLPTPKLDFFATIYSPPIFLNGRLIAAALASSQSAAATPGVRTGTLRPRP